MQIIPKNHLKPLDVNQQEINKKFYNNNVFLWHDTIINESTMLTFGCHIGGNVIIGKGATIYTGAIIGPNVKIGDWSIIGAGSVVLKDVPDNTLVYGNPARVIKTK